MSINIQQVFYLSTIKTLAGSFRNRGRLRRGQKVNCASYHYHSNFKPFLRRIRQKFTTKIFLGINAWLNCKKNHWNKSTQVNCSTMRGRGFSSCLICEDYSGLVFGSKILHQILKDLYKDQDVSKRWISQFIVMLRHAFPCSMMLCFPQQKFALDALDDFSNFINFGREWIQRKAQSLKMPRRHADSATTFTRKMNFCQTRCRVTFASSLWKQNLEK